MPQTTPYLFFDGTCAEAMKFYERTLRGKLVLMKHSETPGGSQAPAGNEDRIMHADLTFDGGQILASDEMAGADFNGMKGFFVSLSFETVDEARRVFDAFAPGGKLIMPLDKTFWAEAFGMVVDRFGTPWMIGTTSKQS